LTGVLGASLPVDKFATCPSSADECWCFPDIDWLVYMAKSTINSATEGAAKTEALLTVIKSTPNITDITFDSYVLSGGAYLNKAINTLTSAKLYPLLNPDLTSASIAFVGADYTKEQKMIGNIKVQVKFTTVNKIPVGGSIEIKCTASEIILYPNCRSMVTIGTDPSTLDAATTNSGAIDC